MWELVGACSASAALAAWMAQAVVGAVDAPPLSALEAVYGLHTVLELALALLKLRGRYQHEAPGTNEPRTRMCARSRQLLAHRLLITAPSPHPHHLSACAASRAAQVHSTPRRLPPIAHVAQSWRVAAAPSAHARRITHFALPLCLPWWCNIGLRSGLGTGRNTFCEARDAAQPTCPCLCYARLRTGSTWHTWGCTLALADASYLASARGARTSAGHLSVAKFDGFPLTVNRGLDCRPVALVPWAARAGIGCTQVEGPICTRVISNTCQWGFSPSDVRPSPWIFDRISQHARS